MKATVVFLFVLTCACAPAHAQQSVHMPELDVSVEIPVEWEQLKTYKVTERLPEMGLYHVMNIETGQAVAIRRDECTTASRRSAWVRGELAEELAQQGDVLAPLTESSTVRFDEHSGFMVTRRRGKLTYMAYLYYLARGNGCYEVALLAPEEVFGHSAPAFQEIVNSFQFTDSE